MSDDSQNALEDAINEVDPYHHALVERNRVVCDWLKELIKEDASIASLTIGDLLTSLTEDFGL